ncbi:MAG: hypothetical protein LBF24_02020 [Puniceicoccales bacterium]|nr:hypothetical protein [Puniceicoccales bacterium]
MDQKIQKLLAGAVPDANIENLHREVGTKIQKLNREMENYLGWGQVPAESDRIRLEFLLQIADLISAQTCVTLGFEEDIATPPANSTGIDWPYWTVIPTNDAGISVDGDLWGPRYVHRIQHIAATSKNGKPQ